MVAYLLVVDVERRGNRTQTKTCVTLPRPYEINVHLFAHMRDKNADVGRCQSKNGNFFVHGAVRSE